MERTVVINGTAFVIRRKSSKSVKASASIRGNAITIRIPSFCSPEESKRIFRELQRKILLKVEKNFKKFQSQKLEFSEGQEIKTPWTRHFISINRGTAQGSSSRLRGETIEIRLAAGLNEEESRRHVSVLARRIISKASLPFLQKHIMELNRQYLNVPITNVYLKDSRSRWGSCSEKGNISINFRLLFAPTEIMDYVIIHELAHLREKNHSSKFWSVVRGIMPDYKEKIKWLRDNGYSLKVTAG